MGHQGQQRRTSREGTLRPLCCGRGPQREGHEGAEGERQTLGGAERPAAIQQDTGGAAVREAAAEDGVRLQGCKASFRDRSLTTHRQVRGDGDLYSDEMDWIRLGFRGLVHDHLECF